MRSARAVALVPLVAALAFPLLLGAQDAALTDWQAKHAKALTAYETAHTKKRASMEKQLNAINAAEDSYRALLRDAMGTDDNNQYMDPSYRQRMKDERYHLFNKDDSSAVEHIDARRSNNPDSAVAAFGRRSVVIMSVLVETDSAEKDATAQLRFSRLQYDKIKSQDDPTMPVQVKQKYKQVLEVADKIVKFARLRQDFHADHAKALRQEQDDIMKQLPAAKAASGKP